MPQYKKPLQTRKRNEEIKDRILRDIRNVFRLEKENKVKYYQLKNILIKFDYI